jgi:hypothetical protein
MQKRDTKEQSSKENAGTGQYVESPSTHETRLLESEAAEGKEVACVHNEPIRKNETARAAARELERCRQMSVKAILKEDPPNLLSRIIHLKWCKVARVKRG